jgi:uncharacterized phage protein (TIGR02218 family)
MSGNFQNIETSSYGGQPIQLYEFRRGSARMLFANCDQPVVAGADTYVPLPISDDGPKQKNDNVTDVFNITVPYASDIAAWFRYTMPSDVVYVVVRRFHLGDTQAAIIWIGSVITSSTSDQGVVTLACHAVAISLRRNGLRLAWQRGCPHALYDQNCKVDKSQYLVAATVTAVGSNYFTTEIEDPPVGQWAGGFVEFEIVPGAMERRLIENWNGNQLFPYGDMDGYGVGLAINLYPGCTRTQPWCTTYFNNYDNYGGFPYMTVQNPYGGNPVF